MNVEKIRSGDLSTTPDQFAKDRRNPAGRLPAWVLVPAWLIFAGTGVGYAFCVIMTNFSYWDDEGFVMIGVRGFIEGHPLYNEIFTHYGPFYYFYEWVIHSLIALPLTHDAVRILTVVHWFAAASLLALTGRKISGSTAIGFFIFAQAFRHVALMGREPGIPQQLVVVLLPLAVLIAAREFQWRWASALLGIICATLLFTKINAGIFFGLGLVTAMSCHTPFFRKHPLLYWIGLVLMAALPCILMRPNLGEGWARVFCGQACIAILAAGSISFLYRGEQEVTKARWGTAGAAAIGISVVVVAIVLLTGTSAGSMVEHLIVSPSKVGASFTIPVKAPYCTWSGVAALLAAAAVLVWRGRLDRQQSVVIGAKALYGVIGALVLFLKYQDQLGYLLPWSWLVILPVRPQGTGENHMNFARIFLCLQAVWQSLQAYPIAGSQTAIVTALPLVMYSLCLYDSISAVAALPWAVRFRQRVTPRVAVALTVLALVSLYYVFITHWCRFPLALRQYNQMQPLELPGCRLIRLPSPQVEMYRELTRYLETECDAFITVPGMNSLYFWTRKAPPNYLNLFEIVLLNDSEQEKVIADLRKSRRPVIVLNKYGAPAATGTGAIRDLIEKQSYVRTRIGDFSILEIGPPAAR